jgi:hypothetical protein
MARHYGAPAAEGGSSLTIGGKLTNEGSVQFGSGNDTLSVSETVKVGSLNNVQTSWGTGSISLSGNLADSHYLLLDVTTGAAGFGTAGKLTGNVTLNGDAAIEFASGQITSIQGSLDEVSSAARIADASNLSANSALTGLTSVSGRLTLESGARLSATGSVTNSGQIFVDQNTGEAGSSLTIAGRLTNEGSVQFGSGNDTLSASETAKVGLLNNVQTSSGTGSISLFGNLADSNYLLLDVTTGAAGFGTAGVLSGNVTYRRRN